MPRRAAASLPIQLDERATSPLHEQICDAIRRAIVAGTIRPRTRIASSRALAEDLMVSRTTTQLALDTLRAEGYLVAHQGAGTFVAARLPDPRIAPPPAPAPIVRPRRAGPLLSSRGALLAASRPATHRIDGPARAFRIGSPALEAFPIAVWSRLASRRITTVTSRDLDYGYGSGGGLLALREAIAEHVRTRGVRCDADQVYIVNSAQRGLDLIFRVLLDEGELAAVEDPGYPGAWSAFASAGARIVPVPVDAAGLDPQALARHPGVRLVYVTPSHQFPLAVQMSLSRRRALVAWAAAQRSWIVEDDYDGEFRFHSRPLPCLQSLDTDGRVIYVGTFSKSVFPALRIGYLIAPHDLRDQLLAVRRGLLDPQPPFLDQAILADFIAQGHFARHLRRMQGLYAARREALVEAAARWCAGALALRPVRSGLHAVGELSDADPVRTCDAAAQRGVEVMPISAYAREATVAPGLVLGFGAVTPAQIDRGMQDLAAVLDGATARRRDCVTG